MLPFRLTTGALLLLSTPVVAGRQEGVPPTEAPPQEVETAVDPQEEAPPPRSRLDSTHDRVTRGFQKTGLAVLA